MRLGNVRWLAGYRHPRHRLLEVTAWLREAFATETPLMTGVESVGDPIMVLPVLFHLLWWQELVTDLSQATPPAVSPPAFLAAAARQYWGIEAVHWIRDVTWGEDHQHAYTGGGVHTLATFRNVALTILRLRGVTQIRRTLQHLHRNPADALALLNPAAT